MGEKMPPFAPDSPPLLIFLIIDVCPTGGIYVRYELLSGEIPQQMPAVFENRERLAFHFRQLGLLDEAAIVTLSETETFTLKVPFTSELMETLGFNKPRSAIH
jgi:hypothetical protein